MGKLRIMDVNGDTTIAWPEDKTEEEVNREFDRLVNGGYMAYSTVAPGKADQLRKFDPQADEIVLHPPLAGG